MKATKLYRIASGLLFVWAGGNTYGLLNFWHVAGSMDPVRFPVGHSGFSYAEVVLGCELFCIFSVLFAAYLAWHLGTLSQTVPKAIGAVGWILFAYSVAGVYVSWIAFSGFVRLLAAAIAICIGWATWLSTAHREIKQRQSERALA
jgi:hypothetical protein